VLFIISLVLFKHPMVPKGKIERGSVQVLEVSARELGVCNHLDLALSLLADNNGIPEVTGASINLDLVLEELLEGTDVEDLVAGGLRGIDDELFSR